MKSLAERIEPVVREALYSLKCLYPELNFTVQYDSVMPNIVFELTVENVAYEKKNSMQFNRFEAESFLKGDRTNAIIALQNVIENEVKRALIRVDFR